MQWNKRNWYFSTIAKRPKKLSVLSNLSLYKRLQHRKPVQMDNCILAVRNVLIRRKSFFCLSASISVCFIIWNLALFFPSNKGGPRRQTKQQSQFLIFKKTLYIFCKGGSKHSKKEHQGGASHNFLCPGNKPRRHLNCCLQKSWKCCLQKSIMRPSDV